MRIFGYTLGGLVLWTTSLSAATLYTWRDPRGVPHYSNVPVTGQRTTPVDDVAPVAAEPDTPLPPLIDGPAVATGITPSPVALSDADRAAFSDRVSLKRQGLEHAYRAQRRRLTDLQHSTTPCG